MFVLQIIDVSSERVADPLSARRSSVGGISTHDQAIGPIVVMLQEISRVPENPEPELVIRIVVAPVLKTVPDANVPVQNVADVPLQRVWPVRVVHRLVHVSVEPVSEENQPDDPPLEDHVHV